MRLLARIGIERDVLDDAQLLLEAVLELAPDYHAARYDYAQVLIERHMYPQAQAAGQRSCSPWSRTIAAIAPSRRSRASGLGQHERAIEIYRELLNGAAQPADLHLSIAHSLKTLGRQRDAIAAYRAAAAARAGFGDAWWSLANLKTYRFAEARARADARRGSGGGDRGWSIDTTCASRSARRSRTASVTRNRSNTMRAATP